jgi:hypothetical protein
MIMKNLGGLEIKGEEGSGRDRRGRRRRGEEGRNENRERKLEWELREKKET